MKYSARFSLYNKGKYNDDNPRPRYCGLNTLQRIRQCVLCLNRQNRARVKYTKADKKKWKEQSNPEKTLKSQWEAESLREKRTKKSEAKKQQKISPWSSCWALLVVEGAMALFKIRWCIRGPKTPARWGGKPRASSMACQKKKNLKLNRDYNDGIGVKVRELSLFRIDRPESFLVSTSFGSFNRLPILSPWILLTENFFCCWRSNLKIKSNFRGYSGSSLYCSVSGTRNHPDSICNLSNELTRGMAMTQLAGSI